MFLYRIAPEGSYAVAEDAGGPLRFLQSNPFRTRPESWELGSVVDPELRTPLRGAQEDESTTLLLFSGQSAPFLAPVAPGKIVGIGRNYVEHARELDHPLPTEPLIFLKAISSVIAPGEPIVLPPASERVEYEGEIAVVLGARLRRATAAEARAAVLGVTCACDVTARDLQNRDATFARAKSFDTFCPLGPAILVDADLDDLEVTTRIDGTERQRGHVRQMTWGLADLLAYVSRVMTLEPGDLLLSGTPAGVGPLADGDRVEVEVSGVGVLMNPVEVWRG